MAKITDDSINILFLGGAKRVSIARMFIRAVEERGYKARLYSYELDAKVPIAEVAEVLIGRRWTDEDVLAHIHSIVEEKSINIIVPFVDSAVGIAARYRDLYGDVFTPVSHVLLCDSMFDKIIAAAVFEKARIPAPTTYHRGKPEFPLIAKPRNGSASKGIRIIENATDFRAVISPPDKYLIQEYIPHRQEITVDCYVTRRSEITCISPRLRLEVVGGEVSRTVTIDAPDVVEVARRAIVRTGLTGAVTVQFIRDLDSDGRLLIMEVNPRLGGGAVCTVHAGGDIPGMIVDEALGRDVNEASALQSGTEIVRYMQEVVFHN